MAFLLGGRDDFLFPSDQNELLMQEVTQECAMLIDEQREKAGQEMYEWEEQNSELYEEIAELQSEINTLMVQQVEDRPRVDALPV